MKTWKTDAVLPGITTLVVLLYYQYYQGSNLPGGRYQCKLGVLAVNWYCQLRPWYELLSNQDPPVILSAWDPNSDVTSLDAWQWYRYMQAESWQWYCQPRTQQWYCQPEVWQWYHPWVQHWAVILSAWGLEVIPAMGPAVIITSLWVQQSGSDISLWVQQWYSSSGPGSDILSALYTVPGSTNKD